MNFDDTLAQMNIELGDSADVTFTPEEKTRALQKAWNDSSAVNVVWDTSLTYDSLTYQYTLPSSLTTIKDIYISVSNSSSDPPTKIDGSLWEVVDGKLQFKNMASSQIPTGYTLYLKGNKGLDYTSDTITNTTLQDYVIALGGWNTLQTLGYKKANLFLKNDLTMSELITLKRDFKQDVNEAKAQLARGFEGV